MKNPKQSLGAWGEYAAAEFYRREGYEVIGCNLRTPYGEIDLVARKDGCTAFVEVKTRRSRKFGAPEVSVSYRKQEHMLACAQWYMQQHPEISGQWRIDVVAIERSASGEHTLTLFENAI